ncbi:hypothetical protein TNCV_993871 [Trichonephila clavipes]|nr:hypothetical protein TNCV_993871 [Trichonephila clavipes]
MVSDLRAHATANGVELLMQTLIIMQTTLTSSLRARGVAARFIKDMQFTCRSCGGGDRGRVTIYRPFGELCRAKSYCHLYGAQGQRQASSCPCHDEFRGPRSDNVRQAVKQNDKESIYNSRNNSYKTKRVGKGGRKKRENRDIDTIKKEVNNLLQDFENNFSVRKIK